MSPFDPRPFLKEIARGEHASRELTREQARELFGAMLEGRVADVALGAALVAFRMKGETAAELAGMLDALAPHLKPLALPRGKARAVVIPTYNGSRKLPNLVPLLALAVAREGVPVLLHGVAQEPQRVSSFEILARLGHPPAGTLPDAERALEEANVAAVPLSLLSPALARIVDRRLEMGVRNSGHTLAKLVLPAGVAPVDAARLVAVTHPEFVALLREHFRTAPANVLLMRGVEGEPVLRLRAPQPIEALGLHGESATHEIGPCEPPASLPARDAQATAAWTRDVLEGRLPMPAAIAAEVALIARHCG